MALTDPRSVIGEILSRRPDLRRTYAPQAEAYGIQIAGLKPAVEARRRLEAANALRAGQVQDTTLGPVPTNMGNMGAPAPAPLPIPKFSGEARRRLEAANAWRAGGPPMPGFSGVTPGLTPPTGLSPDEMALPFNGTGGDPNSLRSMADRGDPRQAPDFRSRLNAAMDTAGVQLPGPKFSTQGVRPDLSGYTRSGSPAAFSGNLPRTRPPEQLSAAGPPSPLTGADPQSSLAGVAPSAPIIGREAPPGLNGPPSPLASSFGDQSQLPGGAFSGSFPQSPQPRPFESTIAARPMPPGGPGSLPAAPVSPVLAGQPFTGSPGMASRFGDQSQLASGAFSGGPPPAVAGGPTPLQLDAAKDMVRQMASVPNVPAPSSLPSLSPQMAEQASGIPNPAEALRSLTNPSLALPTSTVSNPLQRAPLGLAAGARATALPLGSTNMPFAAIPPTPASVAQRTDILGPLPPGAGTGVPTRSAQAPLISVPPAAGTASVGAVTSQPLPPPSATSSIPPANVQAGNLNDVLALSGVSPPPVTVGQTAPPGMMLPPGVTQQDVGRLGFGATNIDPSKAPVQRYGSNTGKYAGAALGALKGLAGGPVGAAVGGFLGYRGGKRVGGLLGDRDFGLGARFTNPNYPQGVVANPPAIMDMGVPPITQAPLPPPPAQSGGLLGGIFGGGRNALGAIREKVTGMVKRGEISAAQGASMLRDAGGSSVSGGNWGSSGGRGMGGQYGGGYGGGGGYYGGGTYGGSGGSNIGLGVGGAYRNR